MQWHFNREQLAEFVEASSFANLAYYRVRRDLWEAFVAAVEQDSGFTLGFETFNAVKSFLLARNEQLDDNKRLAFDRAVIDIAVGVSGRVASSRSYSAALPRRPLRQPVAAPPAGPSSGPGN